MTKRHLILLLLVLLHFLAPGQRQIHFSRLGREEGLSQVSVNCMLRDREGFMWFGTQDGLNRYDGKGFRVFQNQPGDEESLSNNYIVSVCEDEEGYLWIGTMAGGLNRFDKRTEKFRVFVHNDSVNSLSENTVWSVISDDTGHIWAGTSLGVNRYDKKTGLFTVFRSDSIDHESLATDMTVSLYRDTKGRIWAGTVEGLCRFDQGREKFVQYINPFDSELKGANIIWSVSETAYGELVTGTDNGVYLLDTTTGKFRRILGAPDEPQLVAWSVLPLPGGHIWVGSDRGLFDIDRPRGTHIAFLYDPVNPASLPDNYAWCLFHDPGGFLWIGTNNGIAKTRALAGQFPLISADPGSVPRLSSSRVMAILEDKAGNLWIGTDGGGLDCISPDKKKVRNFNSGNSGLRNDNIWALADDESGNIYIGSYNGGLMRLNTGTGSVYTFPMNEENEFSLPNRRVLALLIDRNGDVWTGTRGSGLCRLDPTTGKFKNYRKADDDPSGFPANTVLSLAQDADGRIWAGTQEGGLALYLPEEDRFKTFMYNADDKNSLSDNNIWAIEFDSRGRMWVGTQGGINVSDAPGGDPHFRYYSVKDGLKSNIILGIKEDSEGNIWLSTFSGIARLDIKTLETDENESYDENFRLFHPLFCIFDLDHGLQGLEFNQGSSHKGQSGTLYFGGNNGLNYFHPGEVKSSNLEPPVVLTGFKVFNKEVLIDQSSENQLNNQNKIINKGDDYSLSCKITFVDEVVMSYRERLFAFEFASLDYSNPSKNHYAYKMAGFDKNWNFMGPQNNATFTNLDAGEYTLLVKATNADGVWNPKEKSIRIIITPPFWKTAWFITLLSLTSLIAAFMIIRKIFLNQKRKAEREKELIELQLKTIKSQIDPHFAFNAINTVASFIFTEKPEVTYDYFTQFARMIRSILEDSDKISRPLHEELDFTKNYLDLQKMRFRNKFDYTIEIDEDVPGNTDVPKMIVQSYAENAIKHGLMHRQADGRLLVRVTKKEDILKIVVEDNGVGREKAAELNPGSTHRGFRIMEHITDLYRKLYKISIVQEIEDLKDEAGKASGTRVILSIFMNKE